MREIKRMSNMFTVTKVKLNNFTTASNVSNTLLLYFKGVIQFVV